jgi:hypothetical protein
MQKRLLGPQKCSTLLPEHQCLEAFFSGLESKRVVQSSIPNEDLMKAETVKQADKDCNIKMHVPAILSIVPTVDKVLLGSGESSKE